MLWPNACRVDETYIPVAGRWTYLYWAIDSDCNTINFLLLPKRDVVAAKAFLQLRSGHSPAAAADESSMWMATQHTRLLVTN